MQVQKFLQMDHYPIPEAFAKFSRLIKKSDMEKPYNGTPIYEASCRDNYMFLKIEEHIGEVIIYSE